MSSEAFTYLLKQEIKWNRDRSKKSWWPMLYALVGLIAGLILFTFAIRSGNFKLQYMWFFTYAFPFVTMGTAYGMIAKEWKNRMYSWWLSLPYSRERLVMTKFLAAWIQTIMILAGSFAFIVLFSLYAVLVGETYTMDLIIEQLLSGLPWLFAFITFYPLIGAFSFMTFISSHTKFSAITPLLWVILIVSINGFFWLVNPLNNVDVLTGDGMFRVDFSFYTWLAMLLSWVLAGGILKIVVRWLKKELII